MAKTAKIKTRVELDIKERAEAVLNQLGISMSTAMTIYLKQIVLHRKIPFETLLPDNKSLSLGSLSNDEFDKLMDKAALSYANDLCSDVVDFKIK